MLRKKQHIENNTRNVRHQPAARVFSYYQSRSSVDSGASDKSGQSSTNPNPSWGRFRYIPTFLAGFVLAGCLGYFSTLDTTPKIRLAGADQHTIINDLDTYEPAAKAVLEGSILNRSKVLIDTKKIAQELEEEFPEMGDVTIVLPLLSRRPIIEVRPSRAVLVLAGQGGAFVVDTRGKALASAHDVEKSTLNNLPLIEDLSELNIEQGSAALPEEAVSFIRAVTGQLARKKISIKSLILPPIPSELHVRVQGKPYLVKFNLRGSSTLLTAYEEGRRQAGTYLAVNERLERQNVTPAEYIDVRITGKAFYK